VGRITPPEEEAEEGHEMEEMEDMEEVDRYAFWCWHVGDRRVMRPLSRFLLSLRRLETWLPMRFRLCL
jgi:hypothetical protein